MKNKKRTKKPSHKPKNNQNQAHRGKAEQRLNVNLWGWHACIHAWLNPNRTIKKLYLTEKSFDRFEEEVSKMNMDVPAGRPDAHICDPKTLDKSLSGDAVHQGIAMLTNPLPELDLSDLIIQANNKDDSLIVILDQVTDPHNVGAIIRSASALGATGLLMQTRHAPTIDGVLAKIACGGTEHLPIAYATNLSRAIEQLQDEGHLIYGLDERGTSSFKTAQTHSKRALVLGAEGPGMRRLISEKCDVLVALPTKEPIKSLNVSNAAAIALYAITQDKND